MILYLALLILYVNFYVVEYYRYLLEHQLFGSWRGFCCWCVSQPAAASHPPHSKNSSKPLSWRQSVSAPASLQWWASSLLNCFDFWLMSIQKIKMLYFSKKCKKWRGKIKYCLGSNESSKTNKDRVCGGNGSKDLSH